MVIPILSRPCCSRRLPPLSRIIAPSTFLNPQYSFLRASHGQHVSPYSSSEDGGTQEQDIWVGKEIRNRVEELRSAGVELYPRLQVYKWRSLSLFSRQFRFLKSGETWENGAAISYHGRVESVRNAGSSLFFLNIVRKNLQLQVICNRAQLSDPDVAQRPFTEARKLLQRGDIVAVSGYPCRTDSGQLSLRANELPCVLSPCLHSFPDRKHANRSSSELLPHSAEKHVDMFTHQRATHVLLRRSQIISQIRDDLNLRGFVEVQTPILSSSSGGAIARAFETTASEFPEKKLTLRIAPELWLKRLVLGGMDRIFEIGPSFRNEGIDKLHNPEFTTCEFYCAYTSRQDLLKMTEKMLTTMVSKIESVSATRDPLREGKSRGLSKSELPPLALAASFFEGPYQRIDFLPALNQALDLQLPDLSSDSAIDELIQIFNDKAIALPSHATLPRLLDKLCVTYLEPQCDEPTWIINHPECLSPLSKSFRHPCGNVDQAVGARAELFIRGQEIVNCYEEENSPFEQRRKFIMQQKYEMGADGQTPEEEAMIVDEDYLKALEWGLPPTAGWGCGVDRLVMLLTGQQRINDVLSFGTLRSVARPPEKREMVNIKAPIASSLKEDNEAEARLEAEVDGKKNFSDFETTVQGKAKTEIDPVEEAVMEIRQKINKERRIRPKRRGNSHSNLTAEQKKLEIWLAKGRAPGAADRFLEP